ncbi:MAG TPA: alpha/beta fold hydrolase [Bryobacteraceae bacterium]|nr:alpha/beta fold hydrolase [Bryobacteraceae bacterium]
MEHTPYERSRWYERERWYERDGVRLHAVEAGPPAGPLYILLHGFPEFSYGWRKQIPALASAGYRVIVPDQRGYNLSDKPRSVTAYAVNELAADIISIANGQPFRLAGHDWGAAVAWTVALARPQGLEKLAILNVPHPSVMMKHLTTDPGQLLRSWYMFFFQLPTAPEALFRAVGKRSLVSTSRSGTFTPEDLNVYAEAWSRPGAVTGMINWYRALLRTRPPAIKDPTIRVPTTIIWGARDRFLKAVMAQESARFCPHSRLVYLTDATHWVQHEEPDRVNELLLS